MRAGKLEAMGTPQELYQNPPNLFVANFTGEGSVIKVPHIVNNHAKNVAFFRPEDAVMKKSISNETDFVFKDALVESYEFTGSDYLVRLSYKGQEILVRSKQRPEESIADIYVSKDKLLMLDAE